MSPLCGALGMLQHSAPVANISEHGCAHGCGASEEQSPARSGEYAPLGGWWEQGSMPAGHGRVSQHFRRGGCSGAGRGTQGLCRSGQDGVGKRGEPRVCPERGSHMLCVRRWGYFRSFHHHPERCPTLLFINPLAPAQLQPLTCRKKPIGAKTNRASSIPAGGSAERAEDAPAAAPGPGGRRWPCPGTTAPGPGSRMPRHSRSCPLCAWLCRGPLEQVGDASGIPNAAPRGMLIMPKGREGYEFPQA